MIKRSSAILAIFREYERITKIVAETKAKIKVSFQSQIVVETIKRTINVT